MADFKWAVDLAKQLIDANGEAATIKVYTTVTPNPLRPMEAGESTEQSVVARAVFLNYNTQDAGKTYQDGTVIHLDDKKVLAAAKGLVFDPNLQGTITRETGEVFRVVKIKLLDPGAQKIFFELQVRR